jgi:hypothetical protein
MVLSPTITASDSDRPHVWQRWEQQLVSSTSYGNPYADVTVRVTYSGPGGRTLKTFGFWDGGNIFRLRCAFPAPGTWQWETECTDVSNSGLSGQRGTVEVSAYNGNNPLYQHGFLKVSDSRRYLSFADGSPYLWIGDTAWAAPHRATHEEWETYVADRAAKHFSLVQVGVTGIPLRGSTAPDWVGPAGDRNGEKPFRDEDCREWNPRYWQAFEQKIQRANERGLVVCVVGLMEPVRRYPASEQACRFARSLVARLYGNFVIFSPSMDSRAMPLANEVGQATREATTIHLITQHPGTGPKGPKPVIAEYYFDEPYLDFSAVQSGHNGGDREASARHAMAWVLELYRRPSPKPVINVEAMYDAQGDHAWQAVDARSAAWRSWLSGAKGYSYGAGDVAPKVAAGAGGVWGWVTDPTRYDFWQKALQWESAFQMQYLHDFLAAIEWWQLEPATELILHQRSEYARQRVLARMPRRDFAVAYLPDSDPIEIDVAAFSSPLTSRWFDPVHGRSMPGTRSVPNRGVRRFTPPGTGDWVLILEPAQERAADPPQPQ